MKTKKMIPVIVSGLLLLGMVPAQAAPASNDLTNMSLEELADLSLEAAARARSLLHAQLLGQPVHVVETHVTDTNDERFSTSYETGILIPVIVNDSDTEIHDITVRFAGWNAQGEPVTLQSSLSSYTPGCMPSIRLEGAVLAPGETLNSDGTETYRLFPFDLASPVINARSIVVSYTDDQDQVWENPLLETWTKAYLGGYSEEQEIEAEEEPAEEEPADETSDKKEETEEPSEEPAEVPAEAPAEEPAEAPAEAPAEEPAEASAEVPAEAPAETPAASPTDDKAYVDWMYVYNVQAALNELGYNCGTPDGLAGELTYQSMQKYQEEHGLPVTKTITGRLLDSLGIEHPDN
ncbi:MAG: peptidoglycan-binding protein [Blautia sp.]|nr:peptidoglycan-binding protein [Blautia sp.]